MADRPVTEFDLRADEFKRLDIKPEDYEFRSDGTIARKDRWENGIRTIASNAPGIGSRSKFEVPDVVEASKRAFDAQEVLHGLYQQLQSERARVQGLIDTYDRDEANASRNGFLEGLQSALDLLAGEAAHHDYALPQDDPIPSQGTTPTKETP